MVTETKKTNILIIGPTKPLGGMENCVILHSSLDLGPDFATHLLDTKYHPIVRKFKILKLIYLLTTIIPRMRKLIAKHHIDIVHIHTTSFKNVFKNIQIQESAKKLGVKTIMHIHGGFFDRFYEGLSPFLKKRLVKGLNRSDALICLSEGWKKFYTSTFKEPRVFVLENAINLDEFRDIGEFRDYSSHDTLTALYLGRISERKGVFDLIPVASRIRDQGYKMRFILAGRSERGESRKLGWAFDDAGLKGYYELPGEVTGHKREALFRDADCFILPSHAEGMPITILEAFAAGLPVIVTNVGATPEVIRDGENGILVKPGDSAGMAQALIRLILDPWLRERLGRSGFKDANERFSVTRWVDELKIIYTEVMRGQG